MATRPEGTGGTAPHHSWFHFQSEYEIFQPMSEWQQKGESDVLILYLPGFLKEQLKAETDRNIIRVSGERLVAGNKWNRFREEFQIPENCETKSIHAKFHGGILTITLPRKTGGTIGVKDEKRDFQEPVLQSKTASDPKPQQERDNSPANVNPTISSGKPTDEKSLEPSTPQKSRLKEENDGKRTQPRVAENDEAKAKPITPEKPLEKIVEQKSRSTEKSKLPTDAEIVTKMIVEKENTKKDQAVEDKESKGKQRIDPSIGDRAILALEKYKKAVKGLVEFKKQRQLLVNMGATVLVILALAALVSYIFKSGKAEH
ncbi:unnamed protein product [Fraxinus pennsylvanica]|uniref:SHSP domain-containing protein n=1 Tax=Fraxinus pennsylvanica TaxID=56036 RepID=A0AAD2E7H8_9LAMI|nr:unnamed protein product [Fraxinus pennsylvanica]